jgi:carboxymethylenebutenolidase
MTVQETEIQLPVAEGELPVLIVGAPKKAPTVVVLGEIWAVNQQIRGLCRRLAAEGYTVVAPDLYRGDGIPAAGAPQDDLNRSFDAFPDVRGIRDCRALLRALAKGEFGATRTPVYVWGFCMGGRFAHYLAALGEEIAGALNFYGRLAFPRSATKPFSPLDVCELIQVPYLGVFAEHDPLIPTADVAELRRRLQRFGIDHVVEIFEGAHHGFMNETRPAHNPAIAAAAWNMAIQFIRNKS